MLFSSVSDLVPSVSRLHSIRWLEAEELVSYCRVLTELRVHAVTYLKGGFLRDLLI
jgi:hypothetical protein